MFIAAALLASVFSAFSAATAFASSNDDPLPSVPVLVSPASAAVTPDRSPHFEWEASSNDPINYQIRISKRADCNLPLLSTRVRDTFYDYPNSLQVGAYYWQVRTFNSAGRSEWSTCSPFSTPGLATGFIKDEKTKRPLAGVTVLVEGTEISAKTNALGRYTIPAIPPGDFTLSASLTNYKDATASITITGGARTRADLALPQDPPSVPVLTLPSAFGQQGVTENYRPTFEWQASENNPVRYQIQVSKNSNCSTPIINSRTRDSYLAYPAKITALAPSTYHWRVRAFNAAGHVSDWSECVAFRTPNRLWGVVTDATTRRPVAKAVVTVEGTQYTATTNSLGRYNIPAIPPGDYTLSASLANYKDAATSVTIEGGQQVRNDIILPQDPPSVPVLSLPSAFGQQGITENYRPTFEWQAAENNPARYQIQVSKNSNCSKPILNSRTKETTFSYPAKLNALGIGSYYWRVRSFNLAGHVSDWSECMAFQTPSQLRGTITNADNKLPLADATVTLEGAGLSVASNKTGGFRLNLLPPGDYTITISKEGFQTISTPLTINAGSIERLSVSLPKPPPSAPQLVYPANNDVINSLRPSFDWGDVSNVRSYTLQVSSDGQCAEPFIEQETGAASQFSYPTNLPDLQIGDYYWRVQVKNRSNQLSEWSPCSRFSTPATISGVVTDAKSGEALEGVSISISDSRLSTTSDANGVYTFPMVQPGSLTLSAKLLYFQTTPAEVSISGGQSYTVDFALQQAPPSVPVLTSPASGETITSLRPNFDWEDSLNGASVYELRLSQDSQCASPFLTGETGASQLNYPAGREDLAIGSYFWQVRSGNIKGHFSEWSACTPFHTPSRVSGVISDGLSGSPLAGVSISLEGAGLSTTSDEQGGYVFPLVQPGSYELKTQAEYYRSEPLGFSLTAGVGQTVNAAMQPDPPSTPQPISPVNDAAVETYLPSFEWEAASNNPAGYELQLCTASDCSSAATYQTEETSFTLSGNELDVRRYYWRVRSVNIKGHTSAWSEPATFLTPAAITGRVMTAVKPIGPLSGASVQIEGTDLSAVTNSQGYYTIKGVPAGSSTLTASSSGYLPMSHPTSVSPGQTNTVDFDLLTVPTVDQIKITVTWGEHPFDIDAHLWLPEGSNQYHVWARTKGSLTKAPYANLDKDDNQGGLGPENITITRHTNSEGQKVFYPGTYVYAVFNYANWASKVPSVNWDDPTPFYGSDAVVSVWEGDNLVATFDVNAAANINEDWDWWHVLNIEVGADGSIQLVPMNEVRADCPASYGRDYQ